MFEEHANIPKGWEVRQLDELATNITSGGTPTAGSGRYYTSSGGLPFAKTEDLSRASSKHIEACELQITEAALKESAAKPYPVGTILVSMYGTIGLTKITASVMAANQALCALLPPFRCNADYLYHQLDFMRPKWSRFSGQTTQANISGSIVRKAQVLVPPRNEQSVIAHILDTLDTQIEKTEALIAKLEKVKEGLLHDLLTRGIDENGQLRPSPEQAPELYKESPLGLIPRGWSAACLSDLLASVSPAMRSGPFGSALLKDELVESGAPLLGIDNVKVEEFSDKFSRFVTPEKFAELSRYAVRPNDIMITIMGTVGRCCLVPEDIGDALSSKHTWTLTLDQENYSPCLAMLQINYMPWVLKHFSRDQQGGTMSAIRSETLTSLILPVPPRHEQTEIELRLLEINKRIASEIAALSKMHLEKSGLVDDLLTGRVRVTPLLEQAQAQDTTPA